MKKSLLMKSILLLFALVVGSSAWAATTETLNIKNYASANNWENATQYLTATVGDVTFTADGGGNTGKYYSADDSWRFYAGESATLTISVPTGCTLSSVTPTFTVKDSGGLKFGNNACTSGSAVSVSGTSATFTIYSTSGSKGKVFFTSIAVTYSASSKQDAGLSFAIPSYKVAYDTEFTQTVTNPNDLTVTYASSDETIAVVDENSGEVLVGDKAGTVTITASSAETATYDAGEATYTITVFDANAKGTEKNPYTVTEALAFINTLGSSSSSKVYVRGIVSTVGTLQTGNKAGMLQYYISVDGTDANELYVYNGYGLGGAKFEAASDIAVGDEVLIAGSLKMYESTPEFNQGSSIINLKHGSAAEVKNISVTADKYNTYVAPENLVVPTGVTAFIATGESETTLTLTSVPKIKAGTPVILYADVTAKTNFNFEVTTEDVTYSKTNLLQISDGTTINGVFVLAKNGSNVGFYKWAGGALSPGRVYVPAPANSARDYLEFSFEETTALTLVNSEKRTMNSEYYNLNGQRVAQPTKGLYIVNGKKVVIK